MLRLTSASTVAVLCALAFTGPARAEEPQPPNAVLDRIGRLPDDLIKAKKTDAEIVDALFLAALTRLPTDNERETSVKFIANAKDRKTAATDVAWALVCNKEFLKLHGLDKDVAIGLQLVNAAVQRWGKEDKKEK